MSIANELAYLQGTKQAIRQAIIDKDVAVSVDDTFRSYADKISQIEGGGGGSVKINYNNYTDGENYLPYNENFITVPKNESLYPSLYNPVIWEWNNTIYIGLGRVWGTLYGNNKVYKFNKTTNEYIGTFTVGTAGIDLTFSNPYVWNNKVFFGNGDIYPLNSSTASKNTVVRILDLQTETMTLGASINSTSYCYSIFTNGYLINIDNPTQSTNSNTYAVLVNLEEPTTRQLLNIGTLGGKSICYNDDYVVVAGGGSAQTGKVQKIDLKNAVVITLPNMPAMAGVMKSVCNERYAWFWGGLINSTNIPLENILYQYNLTTDEMTVIELDYYISEPLAKLHAGMPIRIKKNLYERGYNMGGYASVTYQTNNVFIDTTYDDWYVNKKGIVYHPIFPPFRTANYGYGEYREIIVDDNNMMYSCSTGQLESSYQYPVGAIYTINDLNKYITLNTPSGTRISIDGGAEFEATTPTTRVKSPFTGYVKYGSDSSDDGDIEPDEPIIPDETTPTMYAEVTWAGTNEVKIGGTGKTVTAKIFDLSDNEITDYSNYTFEWTNDMTPAQLNGIVITYPDVNKIRISSDNESIIMTEFNLTVTVKDTITNEQQSDTKPFEFASLW